MAMLAFSLEGEIIVSKADGPCYLNFQSGAERQKVKKYRDFLRRSKSYEENKAKISLYGIRSSRLFEQTIPWKAYLRSLLKELTRW